jgi:hypothetical protein
MQNVIFRVSNNFQPMNHGCQLSSSSPKSLQIPLSLPIYLIHDIPGTRWFILLISSGWQSITTSTRETEDVILAIADRFREFAAHGSRHPHRSAWYIGRTVVASNKISADIAQDSKANEFHPCWAQQSISRGQPAPDRQPTPYRIHVSAPITSNEPLDSSSQKQHKAHLDNNVHKPCHLSLHLAIHPPQSLAIKQINLISPTVIDSSKQAP